MNKKSNSSKRSRASAPADVGRVAVTVHPDKQAVVLHFEQPVKDKEMSKQGALALTDMIRSAAEQLP